ncbi:hypothetical protein ABW20_dc0100145 [Dactylellina cionopaga]|nr:hypothetical protein ABW20_dc0100145 [Dactylellina cionopaga]
MSLISISHLHKKVYAQKIAKKYRLACKGDDMFGAKKTCPYICDAEVQKRDSDGASMETAVDPEKGSTDKGEYVLKDVYVDVQ